MIEADFTPQSTGVIISYPNGLKIDIGNVFALHSINMIRNIFYESTGIPISQSTPRSLIRNFIPRGKILSTYSRLIYACKLNGYQSFRYSYPNRNGHIKYDHLNKYFINDKGNYYLSPYNTLAPDDNRYIFEKVERYAGIEVGRLLLSFWASGIVNVQSESKRTKENIYVPVDLIDFNSKRIITIIEDINFAKNLTYTCQSIVFSNITLYSQEID